MASFSYAKLPAYDIPTGIDQKAVDGLNNALTNYAKFQRQDRELDQGQQKIDIARDASGRAAETHAKGMEDDEVKGLALQGKRVLDLAEDDPRRLTAAQSVLNAKPTLKPLLAKYGQDADKDPIGALNYFVTQAGLYKDKDTLEKEALERRVKAGHADYYEGAAAEKRARAGVAQTDADSKAVARDARTSLRRYELMLSARSPEEWAKIQPEISRGFGRIVPFSEREKFIQMHEEQLDREAPALDEEGNLVVQPSPLRAGKNKTLPPPSKLGGPTDEAQEPPAVGEWQTTTMPAPPMKVGVPPPLDKAVDGAGAFARPIAFQPGGTRPAAPEGTVAPQPAQSQQKIDRQEKTIRELGPVVNPRGQQQQADPSKPRQPTETEVQQYWKSIYGEPNRGFKYSRDGNLVSMKVVDDKTRAAIVGALTYSDDAIKDVREALEKSALTENGYNPHWMVQHALDTGTFARANKALNIAIRGVLHGISGAQINIPEQQEYFNSFKPAMDDSLSTARYKLNHLALVLKNIEAATKRGVIDDGVLLELRNKMREGLKLDPLDEKGERIKKSGGAQAPGSPRQSPPQNDPGPGDRTKDRLKSKFGLE
jgi:hypothetical protein